MKSMRWPATSAARTWRSRWSVWRPCRGKLTRIGLSATQTPIEAVARFLTGADPDCVMIDAGHARSRDLQLELTCVPLEAVMSGDAWTLVYDRLAALAAEHRTTLVFVNTRKLTERLARQLSMRLGAEHVMAHHGSMAREKRHPGRTAAAQWRP
jgi:ATP-dependent Lhr-like helicase